MEPHRSKSKKYSSFKPRKVGSDEPVGARSAAASRTESSGDLEVVSAVSSSEPVVENSQKSGAKWLDRGHWLSFLGIFLFTFTLYFRPYELIPALSGFSSIAFAIAIVTLAVFVPTQFALEGKITELTPEVKCVLFLLVWAIITIPLAKDPALAWKELSDIFLKVAIVFIIMINVLRTRTRVVGLAFLGIAVGAWLSFKAIGLYQEGKFGSDGYRVSVDFGGMFGNPNDLSVHFVIFIPLAVALGVIFKNALARTVYFSAAGLMTAGCLVTQSRGGFLGLVAAAAVLAWKFGRKNRVRTIAWSLVVGTLVVMVAPGNYGLRIASIFIPSLDPVGSSSQRTDLLWRSIFVALRNPIGIGFGNSPIIGAGGLGTHNSYTQVWSELGWLGLFAYLMLLIGPLRKLAVIEKETEDQDVYRWEHYFSIGLQASIVGFMVSSFFASIAFHWYIYYPIAFAVAVRRIHGAREWERAEFREAKRNDLAPQPA